MNERIRELAKHAGFYVVDDKICIPTTSEDITEYQEKFAELIVQECADRIQRDSRINWLNAVIISRELKDIFED